MIMFGTQGVDHKFHIVATVLSSSEDQEAHEQAYSAIVREVESIVHGRCSHTHTQSLGAARIHTHRDTQTSRNFGTLDDHPW